MSLKRAVRNFMSETNMILDAVAGVGQIILDELSTKSQWCPEANRYSRAIIPSAILSLLNSDLTKTDFFVLFNLISAMNSSNKIGKKFLATIGLPRMSLYRAETKLTEAGVIYEFEDGSIMVNPNIACLTKFRKMVLKLQDEWKTAITKAVKANTKELK